MSVPTAAPATAQVPEMTASLAQSGTPPFGRSVPRLEAPVPPPVLTSNCASVRMAQFDVVQGMGDHGDADTFLR